MLTAVCCFVSLQTQAQTASQIYISEEWTGTGGLSAVFYNNVSKTDAQRNVYVAGSTLNASGNNDIILQKFNRYGDLLWQQTYNGSADLEDLAADIFIDDSLNVFLTGTITDNVTDGFDLCVQKYQPDGTLEWTYLYDNNGSPVSYDAGTAITGDNNGSVFVTGGSYGNETMADFVTISLDAGNGSENWSSRYDYDNLSDLAAKIAYKQSKVVISGASQENTNPEKWALATIEYNASNGTQNSVKRTTGSMTEGVDEVYDLTIDDDGNVYVAGAVLNDSTGYDASVYKLDDELNLTWEKHIDVYGTDDKAHGIKVDTAGNVYVTGFTTHPNQGKNYLTYKLNASDSLLWKREYNGEASVDDEGVQLVLDNANRIFVAGAAENDDQTDYVTVGYHTDGRIFGQAIFEGPAGLDDQPHSIAIDTVGNVIVTGQTEEIGGKYRNRTVKYGVYEKPIDPVIIDSVPSHNANELIIRFDRSVMNYSAVDNKAFTAGELSAFVKPQAIDSINAMVDFDFSKLEAFKIFRNMKTSDSLSITRLGDTLILGDYWATLSILLPSNTHLDTVISSLDSIFPIVRFSCPNHFYTPDDIPNDELIGTEEQANLIPTSATPNAHINMDVAWNISTGAYGSWSPKVGVYDHMIYWSHEEFGDGSYESSKIKGGYDVTTGTPAYNFDVPYNSHGTAVAGIIAADRNNNIGIAGIAGGDAEGFDQNGVDLYTFGIFHPDNVTFNNPSGYAGVASVAEVIQEGAILTPDQTYGYGLEIQNYSWGGPDNQLLAEAIQVAWRNDCALIASRGNDGDDVLKYPACYNDKQIMNVIASGDDGQYKNGSDNGIIEDFSSSYGGGADFMAPGAANIVTSTVYSDELFDLPCSSILFPNYQCFAGTSASAPHVSGVAALMLSAHSVFEGAPNDLSPEDMEKILEKTANGGSYSDLEGWGLINAGAAVEQVNYPEYYIIHPEVSDIQSSTVSDVVLILVNNTYGLASGTYLADRYNVQFTYEIELPNDHEIIDWWPLESKIFPGLSAAVPNSGAPWMIVNSDIDVGSNTAIVTFETYTWWVKEVLGTQQEIYQALPPYLNVGYGYSLHVRDNSITSVSNIDDVAAFELFPNPASNQIFISTHSQGSSQFNVEIYDAVGKHVLSRSYEFVSGHQTITIDTSSITNGLYHCKLQYDDGFITKKLIINH